MEIKYEFTSNCGIYARWLAVLNCGRNEVVTITESLEKLVENLQAEISNLRAQVSSGRPTAPKDLSLISLIPKWSGTEESVSVVEFFDSVKSSAKIGNWIDFDKVQITAMKLTEVAKVFYSSNPELHSASISWEHFKAKICKDLGMSKVTSITLCSFRQISNRRTKLLENFWTGVVHLL